MRVVTVSEIRTYRTCERLWQYKYQLSVRPALESKALMIGHAIHLALEIFWRGDPLALALEELEEVCQNDFWKSETGRLEKARVKVMITAYWGMWEPTRKDWKTLPGGVERIIQLPVKDGIVLGGKVDALARYKDGRLFMIEHKTSSEEVATTGADYWQRLALDSQIDTYQSVLEEEFGEPVSIMYDVLKKITVGPKLKKVVRRKKDEPDEEYEARRETNEKENRESLEEYGNRILADIVKVAKEWFVRREIVRLQDQRDEYLAERDYTLQRMFEPDRTTFPRNDGACNARFGVCPYLGVCAGTATLDDPKFAQVEDCHPELDGKLDLSQWAAPEEGEPDRETDHGSDDRDQEPVLHGDDPGPIPF